MFMHILFAFGWWRHILGVEQPPDFVAESFLDSRLQYESLVGLMDFLAFLVQKLWQDKQKIIGESPLIP